MAASNLLKWFNSMAQNVKSQLLMAIKSKLTALNIRFDNDLLNLLADIKTLPDSDLKDVKTDLIALITMLSKIVTEFKPEDGAIDQFKNNLSAILQKAESIDALISHRNQLINNNDDAAFPGIASKDPLPQGDGFERNPAFVLMTTCCQFSQILEGFSETLTLQAKEKFSHALAVNNTSIEQLIAESRPSNRPIHQMLRAPSMVSTQSLSDWSETGSDADDERSVRLDMSPRK